MHINVFVESMLQDLRYALRTLKNSRLITVAAVVALALGIGANATVFTVVSSALRFDMGVDQVERMVILHPGEGTILAPARPAPLDVLNLRSQVRSIEHLAAYRFTGVNLSDSRALPERLWCVQMTASGWAMVRQKPLLGRSFAPDDERADSIPTVMLTHKVWERRYGNDPAILGKAMRIDSVDHIVVGIMPPGAQFPEDTDLWTPLTIADLANPAVNQSLMVFGWLAPNATFSAAQSEVDPGLCVIGAEAADQVPRVRRNHVALVRSKARRSQISRGQGGEHTVAVGGSCAHPGAGGISAG